MGYYDDTMSRITREQYADYMRRFLPYENKLIDLATNDQLLQDQLSRNAQNVSGQFESSQLAGQQRAARIGLSDADTAQQGTNTDLREALTLASVQNETRQAVGDLQDRLITGAAGSASSNIKNIG